VKKSEQWIKFATLALRVAEGVLPAYAHKFSPQRYTLPQLAACVLLKEYQRQDWRGIQAWLKLSPPLCHCLGLRSVPDYSTLWYFAKRWLDQAQLSRLQAQLLRRLKLASVEVALDSTGLDPETCSTYYRSRRLQHPNRKRYVKVSLSVVVGALVAASAVADWGPCGDKVEVRPLLDQTARRLRVKALYADGAYDAEWVHVWCREQANLASWIPATVHRPDGQVGGFWRAHMRKGLPKSYGRRWAVESFFSGMKRTLGSTLRARQPQQQLKEALRKVLVYSIHR
jgi:hypothetical protein